MTESTIQHTPDPTSSPEGIVGNSQELPADFLADRAEEIRALVESCLPLVEGTASREERLVHAAKVAAAEHCVRDALHRNATAITPTAPLIGFIRPIVADFQARSLLNAARTGDKAALAALWKLYTVRVRGAIRSQIRNEATVEEIANDVFLKLHNNLEQVEADCATLGAWLSAVARNAAIDWLRRSRGLQVQQYRHTPEELFDELLELMGKDSIPPHYVIVFGLLYSSGISAGEIANKCLDIPLGQLEQRMRDQWRSKKSIAAPDSELPLRTFLPPGVVSERVIERWIASARNLAQETLRLRWPPEPAKRVGPIAEHDASELSPAAYDALLAILLQSGSPPHQKLVFMLHSLLKGNPEFEYSPMEIDRRLGATPLHELAARVEIEYSARSFLPSERISEIFAQLRAETAPGTQPGESTLRTHSGESRLSRAVPHWIQSVQERTFSAILREEGEALKTIFSGSEPPHELLAFGFTALLRWTPQRLGGLASEKLDSLEKLLESEYGKISKLAPRVLGGCFTDLKERLRAKQTISPFRVGQAALAENFDGNGPLRIAGWRDAVRERVHAQMETGARELIFWYVCKYF